MSSLASDRLNSSNLRLAAVPSPERSEATPSRLQQAHAQRQTHLREYASTAAEIDATTAALGADRAGLEETQRAISATRDAIDGAAADLTVSLPTLSPEQRHGLVALQEAERLQKIRLEARTARLTELEGRRNAIRQALAADTTRLRAAAVAEQAQALAAEDSQIEALVADLRSRLIRRAALVSHLDTHANDQQSLLQSRSASDRRVSAALRSVLTVGPYREIAHVKQLMREYLVNSAQELRPIFDARQYRELIQAHEKELAAELQRLTTTEE